MKTFLRMTLLVLGLATVALISALTAMHFAIHGREVAVPRFVGLMPADAEQSAADAGLQIEVERQFYSAQIPIGKIVSQVPEAGAVVKRGWRVRVAQSLGPQRVAIPNVIGQTERVAELNVKQRGLQLGSGATVSIPGQESNKVVAQDPAPNATGATSPNLSLLVTGDGQRSYVMPSFIGQPLASATQAVTNAGLSLGAVTTVLPPEGDATPSMPPGPASLILSQAPAPGQRVQAGSTINFQVNR